MKVRDLDQVCESYTLFMIVKNNAQSQGNLQLYKREIHQSPFKSNIMDLTIKDLYADDGVNIEVGFDKDLYKILKSKED